MPPIPNIDDLHRRGCALLSQQARSLDGLIHDLHQLDLDMDQPTIRVPLLMLQAVGVSIHSILRLMENRDMAIRDAFGIARSAVETSVNAAYIAVGGAQVADSAIKHMRQKRWRDLNREANIGGSKMTVSRDIGLVAEDLPGLPEALHEFTNAKGKEVRDWTSENIDERIAAVSSPANRAGVCLGIAVFTIYRPSSELLHGTYYGVDYFWRGSREQPARSKAAFDHLWLLKHFVTLMGAAFFASSGAIEAIAITFKLPLHVERQAKLAEELTVLIDDMHALDEEVGEIK